MKKNTSLFENLTVEEKIKYGKAFAFVVILAIIMGYCINFAVDSSNYVFNKKYSDIFSGDYICNGVYIESVAVGGLTKDQAIEVAEDSYKDKRLDKKTISVVTDYGYRKELTFGELGASYDIKGAVEDAYAINRSGSTKTRITNLDDIDGRGEHITPEYSIDEKVLKAVVDDIVEDVSKEYALKGKKVDEEKTYDMIFNNLQIQQSDIEIFVPEDMSSGE